MNKIMQTLLSKEYKNIYLILFLILIIRCFILEPFRIPSGSMKPTILIGDFIFVNKFIYGLNIPIINKKININTPERGDIIVFKKTDNINYIKRVIGVGTDKISYQNKTLHINNRLIKNKYKGEKINFNINKMMLKINYQKEYLTPKKEYYTQICKNTTNQEYNYSNITLPKNTYFVLGDNRDNSEDSRFWGLVKGNDVIGKAFIIWMSIDYKIIDIRWERLFKFIN